MIPKCIKQKQLEDKVNSMIETITNGNGTAIKFADGIMICYKQAEIKNVAIQNNWASGLYSSSEYELGETPAEFIDFPIILGNPSGDIKNAGSGYALIIPKIYTTSKNSFGKCFFVRNYLETNITVYINLVAIGRWK